MYKFVDLLGNYQSVCDCVVYNSDLWSKKYHGCNYNNHN